MNVSSFPHHNRDGRRFVLPTRLCFFWFVVWVVVFAGTPPGVGGFAPPPLALRRTIEPRSAHVPRECSLAFREEIHGQQASTRLSASPRLSDEEKKAMATTELARNNPEKDTSLPRQRRFSSTTKKASSSMLSASLAALVASLVLWGTPLGGSLPPAMASDDVGAPAAAAVPSTNPSLDYETILRSLKPATADQPQIPFPRAPQAPPSSNPVQSSATKMLLQPLANANAPPKPIPQANQLKETPYTLPALISVETAKDGSRPYNGADVLVVRVYAEDPATASSSDSLGGAKIPISVLVGGFPVRVSLGPQNAAGGSSPEDWKRLAASQSLYLRAAICREAGSTTSPGLCPSDAPQIVLSGTGFSKWIDLSGGGGGGTNGDAGTTDATHDTNAPPAVKGVRAPASLVLVAPTSE